MQTIDILEACKQLVDSLALGQGISYNRVEMLLLSNCISVKINELNAASSAANADDNKQGEAD